MKYIAYYLIRLLISIVDFFIPTTKDLWVFYITPKTCWDANMQCVYALARKRQGIQCVISYLHPIALPHLNNTPCFSILSLSGLWNCLRAGVVFFDHALIPGITYRHRQCVNLWHGIPIKQIRFFCKKNFPVGYLQMQTRNTTLLISSSPVDRLAMIACFQIPQERVVITGLPRNDLLFNEEPFVKALPCLTGERQRIIEIKQGRKLVLYAPTYREISDLHYAGPVITSEDEALLAEILMKHEAVLGIREHLFSSSTFFLSLYEQELAVALPTQTFSNTNLLLTAVDLLITDYSSIWVDFLLLDRPIIGFCPDMEDYLGQRGFLYDFINIFPGPLAGSVTELTEKLDTVLSKSDDELPQKQRMIRQLFHKYNDGRNTERVLQAVKQRQ